MSRLTAPPPTRAPTDDPRPLLHDRLDDWPAEARALFEARAYAMTGDTHAFPGPRLSGIERVRVIAEVRAAWAPP